VGFSTTRQNLGLLDPVLLLDAPLDAQSMTDAGDIRRLPGSDLGERANSYTMESGFDAFIDRADTLQIVGRTRRLSRQGAMARGWGGDLRGSGRGLKRRATGLRAAQRALEARD
jgi:hypothetical protein